MSLIGVGVTIGTADVAGLVPITVVNLGADVLQIGTDNTAVQNTTSAAVVSTLATASADLSTLGTQIATALSAVNTGTAAAATAVTAGGSVATKATLCVTDFTTLADQATYGLATLFNNQTWTAGSLQLSGTPGSSVTLTVTQQESVIAAVNALGTAILGNQTAANTSTTDIGAVSTDLGIIYTDVNALGTATVATDITNAASTIQSDILNARTTIANDVAVITALIPTANVYIQTDTSLAPNAATLNGALVAALTFVRDNGILPT